MAYEDEFYYGLFPDNFAWSTATASYQIEGGWNEDGKGPSIWDTYSHQGKILNNDTGDIACDSYHKYQDDIRLLKNLKVSHYRFSISWPRVLPRGTKDEINEAGIAYYSELINALLDAEITPMVTLNHWDLPQALEDQGGWLNEDSIVWFTDYARICFENFGDRVGLWITHNEPWVISVQGYEQGLKAPGKISKGYNATHNLIRAHARTYRMYDTIFRSRQKGLVGITLSHTQGIPKDPSRISDVDAAETFNQFGLGWFANPIFGNGDYPDVMKWQVGNKSLEEGLLQSRLPAFTEEEIQLNKGSADFLGINLYTSRLISPRVQPLTPAMYETDSDVKAEVDPEWPGSGSEWLKVTPKGMRLCLNWIKSHYNNCPVYVTENGVSDNEGLIHDVSRISYYRSYINEVLKAVRLDGCDVRGYTAWSLMDNFEWMRGYSERFGLHYVDFSDPERPRTPKDSAAFYRSIIETNGFLKKGVDKSESTPPHSLSFTTTKGHTETKSTTAADGDSQTKTSESKVTTAPICIIEHKSKSNSQDTSGSKKAVMTFSMMTYMVLIGIIIICLG